MLGALSDPGKSNLLEGDFAFFLGLEAISEENLYNPLEDSFGLLKTLYRTSLLTSGYLISIFLDVLQIEIQQISFEGILLILALCWKLAFQVRISGIPNIYAK